MIFSIIAFTFAVITWVIAWRLNEGSKRILADAMECLEEADRHEAITRRYYAAARKYHDAAERLYNENA